MLHDILHAEATRRATIAAEKAAFATEHASIVAGIHAAIQPDLAKLTALKVRGDYGRPVPLVIELTNFGIVAHLGSRISPAELVLRTIARKADAAPFVEFEVRRYYPYRSEHLATYVGHYPAADMVAALLEALAPHIVLEGDPQ